MSAGDLLLAAWVVVRVLCRCPELLYYMLPQGLRGPRQSPWDSSS